MTINKQYASKLKTPEECVANIKSGEKIFAAPVASFPLELVNALSARDDISGIQMYSALMVNLPDFLGPDQLGRIHYHSAFMGPAERMCMSTGIITPISVHFSNMADLAESIDLNTVLMEVSPPDADGYMSIGPCAPMTGRYPIEKARNLIVQVNPNVPFVNGTGVHIHIDEVDMLCEVDRPLFEMPDAPADETEIAIAKHIEPMIPDGATLQLGIGKLANAVGDILLDKKDLGIHTEVLTPSMVNLYNRGVITNHKKDIHRGKIVCSFCLGRKSDYEFLDRSAVVEMYPTKYVNDPYIIAQHKNFISVNNALAVDLTGQVASESMGFEQYSATGGQLDFVRGAKMSEGGKSFLALKSTAKNNTLSRVQLALAPGTAVTTPRSDVQYIVTEYGVADLHLKSIPERVKAMISIAHPNFREELTEQAIEAGLISSSVVGGLTSSAA